MPPSKPSAYIVAVDMGYGHERAAYGLRELGGNDIIIANNYTGIPASDKRLWGNTRKMYETVSRLKPIPIIGEAAFEVMDHFQRIESFYPRRDLSAPTMQLKQTYYGIEKLGLCQHLIQKLSKKPLPLITTFFVPAFAAEVNGYPEDIYLVICDADISRAWAPKDPKTSRIKYFAPNGRVVERLKLYGVKPENIFLTGFPLPPTLIGNTRGDIARTDLMQRICNLDPQGIFIGKYTKTINAALGAGTCTHLTPQRPTLMFSIGGAGAQRDLAWVILKSLRPRLLAGDLIFRLNLGVKKDLLKPCRDRIKQLKLESCVNTTLFIDLAPNRQAYFQTFTELLHTTDILWTKPSELSFYCGLGLPIIMAPSIGSQEQFNRIWLKSVGAGVTQGDPRYVNEWLFDWMNSGGLARMAWNGFIEAPTHGAYRIESIITGKKIDVERIPLIV